MQATPSGLRLLLRATRPNRPRGFHIWRLRWLRRMTQWAGQRLAPCPAQPFCYCCLSSLKQPGGPQPGPPTPHPRRLLTYLVPDCSAPLPHAPPCARIAHRDELNRIPNPSGPGPWRQQGCNHSFAHAEHGTGPGTGYRQAGSH